MNIGIFTDSYLPEVSGLVTSIDMLKKELIRRGHNVYIFTTSNPLEKRNTTGVYRLPSIPFIFLKSRRVGVFYSHKISKLVKRLNLDIIHTQTEFSLGVFGNIIAKRMNIPIVHTYHTLYKDYVHYISKGKFIEFSKYVVKIFSKGYCNKSDTIIVPTAKVHDILRKYDVVKPIKVIPTGINLSKFKNKDISEYDLLALKQKYGVKTDEFVILFVGRVAKEKSIDIIIKQIPQILKQLPKCKLLIVGGGPSENELKQLTKELNITNSVIFTGEQPWEEIEKFYKIGNVFVSSSITETQGITLIEAMASLVPVVAKKDRNIEELIIDNENGRIFTNDNELPNIIINILTNKELANKYIKNATKTVERYSIEEFGKSVENLYLELIKNGRKSCKKA